MSCFEVSELRALIGDPSAPRERLEEHLDGCERCRRLLSELIRGGAEEAEPVEGVVLPPGAEVGRYVVLEALGAGTSSLVYLAYDPQLDRQLSLKIVRADVQRALGEAAVERAGAEARAMARLSDPHVVTVHDVGTFRGQLFIAMELVANGSVEAWLRQKPRGWKEIVRCFRAAALGLAAAHRAGIIHGDFKPANVLVDADGLGRVSDFGLSSAVVSGWLTGTPVAVGTPLYMAPEQFAGHGTDERTDQYSFCVSLYEALAGAAPVRGPGGKLGRAPAPRGVPRWVWRCVLRGLAPNPAERHPTLAALADALDGEKRTSRIRRSALGAAALGLGLLAGALLMSRDRATRCDDAEAGLAGVWDASTRRALEGAFAAAARPYSPSVVSHTVGLFDAAAHEWVTTHHAVCEATWVRGEQSEALLDARMGCLARSRLSLKSIVAAVTTPDTDVLDNAARAAGSVESAHRCLTADRLGEPTDPRQRVEQAALHTALARAAALEATGRYALALAEAQAQLGPARLLGPAAQAEVELAMGHAHHRLGDGAAAERALFDAVAHATEARAERTAMLAWVQLVSVQGLGRGHLPQAHQAAQVAEAMLKRTSGELDVAADLKTGVASALRAQGDLNEAERLYREVVALRREAHGASHPLVATALINLALVEVENGALAASLESIEEAQRGFERFQGLDHPDMAFVLNTRGILEWQLGHDLTAVELFRQAAALREQTVGPLSRLTATPLSNECGTMVELGLAQQALPWCERALFIVSLPETRQLPLFANAHHNLGLAHLALGHLDQAEHSLEQAVSAREKSQPTALADDLIGLGRVALARRKADVALPLFERALAARLAGADLAEQGEAEFWVARALWQHGSLDRAENMLNRATHHFFWAGERGLRLTALLNDWLSSRAAPPP